MFCKPLLVSTFVLAAGALAFAATQSKDQKEQPKAGAAAQTPPMPQPGAEHKKLLEGVGEWEGTITMSMPGQPTTPAPAKESVQAIGGFWTQTSFNCEFMGMPYHGTGCTGYDPNKKKYVGTWIDNMSPEMALMEGDMDAKTNTLTMRWVGPDETGQRVPHRYECAFTSESYTSTFYKGDGAGTKTMVIAMKRKGGKPVPASGQK